MLRVRSTAITSHRNQASTSADFLVPLKSSRHIKMKVLQVSSFETKESYIRPAYFETSLHFKNALEIVLSWTTFIRLAKAMFS